VNGTLIGQSEDVLTGAFQAFAYRADVTDLIHGNDSYTIGGLPSSGPSVNDSVGASLIVIYSLAGANPRVITINEGQSCGGSRLEHYRTSLGGFVAADPPTEAKVTFVVGSGQGDLAQDYAGINASLLATEMASAASRREQWLQTYDCVDAFALGSAAEAISSRQQTCIYSGIILREIALSEPTTNVTLASVVDRRHESAQGSPVMLESAPRHTDCPFVDRDDPRVRSSQRVDDDQAGPTESLTDGPEEGSRHGVAVVPMNEVVTSAR